MELGFTGAEFDVLRSWSSWAITAIKAGKRHQSRMLRQQQLNQQHGDAEHIQSGPIDSSVRTNDVSEVPGREEMEDEHEESHTADLSGQSQKHGESLQQGSSSVIRPTGSTEEQRTSIGFMVKRLFDYGRIQYMQKKLGMSISNQEQEWLQLLRFLPCYRH